MAGLFLAGVGLVSAFGAVAVVRGFDEGEIEREFLYVPGLLVAVFGGLAVLYSARGSRGLLWATTVVSVVYSFLIVFGAGFLPLIASLVLLIAVAMSTLAARHA
ncbi:MAG TPA: hypothetical protein VE569_11060 [Acidimicrobiia bacterium]|nr:hypothetical protein [Acidimicrobiia bacterium]